MKSTVETLEPTKVKVTVEVPYAELKPFMDKVYKEFAGQIRIPGFRPGKAPARVIESRIGRGPVLEETINKALPEFYGKAVQENSLIPLGRPEVEVNQTPNLEGEAGGDLGFDFTVEVAPEFELPELSAIELQVPASDYTDADVQEELDKLRSRFATLTTVKRAARKDDFVVLDLKAVIDGEEVDSVSQVSYQVGSGRMLEGLDEALEGMKAGESKTFTAPLAGGEHAGEEAEVTVTPGAVKEQELPEVDDEFAQMVSEHDTVDELMEDIRSNVKTAKITEQAVAARNELLEVLLDKADFPLPKGVIEQNVQERTGEDASEEDVKEATAQAERELRTQLLLDRLATEKQVGVSQQELFEFIMQTSQAYGIDPSVLLSNAESQNRLPGFITEIARNKALAMSLREVAVKDDKGNVVDLSEFIGEEDEGEADSSAAPASADDSAAGDK